MALYFIVNSAIICRRVWLFSHLFLLKLIIYQSKITIALQGIAPIVLDMLVDSNKKKLVSTTVFPIITFLIHIKIKNHTFNRQA